MHETTTEFRFFKHQAWSELFKVLRPVYNQPTASYMGCKLLDHIYEKSMNTTVRMIQKHKGGVLGIYGAKNFPFKSVRNVILHLPHAVFIEYLRSDLLRETTENFFSKINDDMKRLDEVIAFRS